MTALTLEADLIGSHRDVSEVTNADIFAIAFLPMRLADDEAILKQVKGPVNDGRSTSSVVRTISE